MRAIELACLAPNLFAFLAIFAVAGADRRRRDDGVVDKNGGDCSSALPRGGESAHRRGVAARQVSAADVC